MARPTRPAASPIISWSLPSATYKAPAMPVVARAPSRGGGGARRWESSPRSTSYPPVVIVLVLGCCLPVRQDHHVHRRHSPAVPGHRFPKRCRGQRADCAVDLGAGKRASFPIPVTQAPAAVALLAPDAGTWLMDALMAVDRLVVSAGLLVLLGGAGFVAVARLPTPAWRLTRRVEGRAWWLLESHGGRPWSAPSPACCCTDPSPAVFRSARPRTPAPQPDTRDPLRRRLGGTRPAAAPGCLPASLVAAGGSVGAHRRLGGGGGAGGGAGGHPAARRACRRRALSGRRRRRRGAALLGRRGVVRWPRPPGAVRAPACGRGVAGGSAALLVGGVHGHGGDGGDRDRAGLAATPQRVGRVGHRLWPPAGGQGGGVRGPDRGRRPEPGAGPTQADGKGLGWHCTARPPGKRCRVSSPGGRRRRCQALAAARLVLAEIAIAIVVLAITALLGIATPPSAT
jgi:hypothetical protein